MASVSGSASAASTVRCFFNRKVEQFTGIAEIAFNRRQIPCQFALVRNSSRLQASRRHLPPCARMCGAHVSKT